MASTTDIAAEPAPLHKHPYHLVDPSPWPIVGSFAGGAFVLGIGLTSLLMRRRAEPVPHTSEPALTATQRTPVS